MKMKSVNKEQFDSVINKIEAELTGSDVGRTHGIFQYTRNGKTEANSCWYKEGNERIWTYEIANYLAEAYLNAN